MTTPSSSSYSTSTASSSSSPTILPSPRKLYAPEVTANIFSKVLFSWVTPLIVEGYRVPLNHDNLWDLPEYEKISTLFQEYESIWKRLLASSVSSSTRPPSLIYVLFLMIYRPLVQSGIFMMGYIACQLATPILLREVVNTVSNPLSTSNEGIMYALILAGVTILGAILNQHTLHLCFRMAQRLRAVLIAAVYRRALLHPGASSGSTSGQVVNLLASDAGKFIDVLPLIHFLWAAPVIIIVATYFLISYLGVSALAGIGLLIALVPLNSSIMRKTQKVRKEHMKITDERVRMCSELLNGIRVVKLNGWEMSFGQSILKLREKECEYIHTEAYLYAGSISLLVTMPVLAMASTFTVYSLLGNVQNSANSFAALSFFNVIRFPLNNLSNIVTQAAQLLVSLNRLANFLGPEGGLELGGSTKSSTTDETNVTTKIESSSSTLSTIMTIRTPMKEISSNERIMDNLSITTPLVQLQNAHFTWTKPVFDTKGSSSVGSSPSGTVTSPSSSSSSSFSLQSIHLTVYPNELVAIVGSVAAGKSSLLQALLGEMHTLPTATTTTVVSPTIYRLPDRPIGYASQVPWVFNGSIRDNIVFGASRKWDEEHYRNILYATCLFEDCASLPAGDLTIVGEKGVTISGGQKARLSLARAAYDTPRILLLDDPLSALDAHTARKVFDRLLSPNGLLQKFNCCRILVTHAVQYLPSCHNLLVLEEGKQIYFGTYTNLLNQYRPLAQNNSTRSEQQSSSSFASSPLLSSGSAPSSPTLTSSVGTETLSPQALQLLQSLVQSTIEHEHQHNSSSQSTSKPSSSATVVEPNSSDTLSNEDTDDENVNDNNEIDDTLSPTVKEKVEQKLALKSDTLMTTEERATGSVPVSVYLRWYIAGGGLKWVLILLCGFILERITYVGSDTWLAAWTARSTPGSPLVGFAGAVQGPNPLDNDKEDNIKYWLLLYTIWGISNGFAAMLRTFTYARIGATATEGLFQQLLHSILRSPMSFFETTPLGRILNRLAGDVDVVDSGLLVKIMSSTASTFWIISAVIVNICVFPYMAAVLFPVIFVYGVISSYFRATGRELQRLDNISRSPLQAHFSESLIGAVTIRAFGAVDRFVTRVDYLMDHNNQAFMAYNTTIRWLSTRLELLGAVVVLAVALLAYQFRDIVPGGFVGLALLWSQNLTISMNFNSTYVVATEAAAVSIQRILTYTDELEYEASLREGIMESTVKIRIDDDKDNYKKEVTTETNVHPSNDLNERKQKSFRQRQEELVNDIYGLKHTHRLPKYRTLESSASKLFTTLSPVSVWPSKGTITFNNVYLRYRPNLPYALAGLSMNIQAGEFVAIVGRTGSGKSTIAAALFRLVEITNGSICIDDQDIRSLGLQTIRGTGIGAVPQDPVLFHGSVRKNLDPFHTYTDEECWGVLEAVHLDKVFIRYSNNNGTVNSTIGSKGSSSLSLSTLSSLRAGNIKEYLALPVTQDSLSLGEKQILCLARVMLRKPRILLLDEATASVDTATDRFITKLVKKYFIQEGCTVLCIAHRLSTVIEAHRVLVMANGKAVEFDTPYNLLNMGSTMGVGELTSNDPSSTNHSVFSNLVKACGPQVEAHLRSIAKKIHQEWLVTNGMKK